MNAVQNRYRRFYEERVLLEHFKFDTSHSAFPAQVNCACASWTGGGAPRFRRQSNFILKLP
jgi:hypothetical protein